MKGKTLRVALAAPGRVEWTTDRWASSASGRAVDTGVGIFYVDVPEPPPGADLGLRMRIDGTRDGDVGKSATVFAKAAL